MELIVSFKIWREKKLDFLCRAWFICKKNARTLPMGGGDTYDLFLGDGVIYEVYYKYDERAEIAFNH